jgi:hypothetical protein
MNESLGRTWNGRYRWELRNPHHFPVLISLNKTMYNPSITKRPLILNVSRVPLTVKPKRLRYTISSHRTRIVLLVRDIPLKPGSKFVCINIRNRLIPQYFNKTVSFSRSYTAWFKKMESISYVYIFWTIHGMRMIYIIFERGGPKFSNTTARALA